MRSSNDMESMYTLRTTLNLLPRLALVCLSIMALYGCGGAEENGGAGAPGTCTSLQEAFVNSSYDNANSVQGGLLYDNWWVAFGTAEPAQTHEMWDLRASNPDNTRTGSATWRCKECHGWDYKGAEGAYGSGSHFTGFPGVWAARAKNRLAVFCAIKSGENINENHRFGGKLNDQSILNLTKFITSPTGTSVSHEGLIDANIMFDVDNTSVGNGDNGEVLFTSATANGCGTTSCHKIDGKFNIDPDEGGIGGLAANNPWELLHKIRFGHPGEFRMPAYSAPNTGFSLTESQIADVIKYAQESLDGNPSDGGNILPSEVDKIILGGKLYDNWIREKGVNSPPIDNPLWLFQIGNNTRTGATTWRCKECHGWDYKGADGAYGSNSSHYTGFPGVRRAGVDINTSESEVADFITNGILNPLTGERLHTFLGLLSEDEITTLAKFIKKGSIETDDYISPFLKFAQGDLVNGETQFLTKPFGVANGNCELCHGTDGQLIDFNGGTPPPLFLGHLARDNPWEVLHKIRFGQAGTRMTSMFESGLSIEDAIDVLTYTQTLP